MGFGIIWQQTNIFYFLRESERKASCQAAQHIVVQLEATQRFSELAGGSVGEEEPGSSHVASAAQCLWMTIISIPYQFKCISLLFQPCLMPDVYHP